MVLLADRGDNRFRDQKRLRNSPKTDAANSSVASVVRSVLFGITRVSPFCAVNIIIVPFFIEQRASGRGQPLARFFTRTEVSNEI